MVDLREQSQYVQVKLDKQSSKQTNNRLICQAVIAQTIPPAKYQMSLKTLSFLQGLYWETLKSLKEMFKTVLLIKQIA